MLTIGVVYMVVTLVADIGVLAAEPADPAASRRMSIADVPVESRRRATGGSSTEVRRELLRELLRSPRSSSARAILLIWIICAIFGSGDRAAQPVRAEPRGDQQGAVERAPVRDRPARPRHVLARDRRRARHPDHRAAGDAARDRARDGDRAGDGLLPRLRRRRARPVRRGVPGAAAGRHRRDRALDPRALEPGDHHRDRARVHAADRAHGPRRGAARARARLRRGRAAARREAACTSCSSRSCPNVFAPIMVEFTVRLGVRDLHGR